MSDFEMFHSYDNIPALKESIAQIKKKLWDFTVRNTLKLQKSHLQILNSGFDGYYKIIIHSALKSK